MKVDALPENKRTILEETGALLKGHFKLTSGLHSDNYFQCAQIFQYPEYSEIISVEIAASFKGMGINLVAAPAVGGIITGYEIARALNCRNIFAERVEGKMALRRGFVVNPGDKVLIIEDVITTGGSILEIAEIVKESGAEIVGYSSVLNRSAGRFNPDKPYKPWLALDFETWQPDDCPLCKQGIPIYQPGSRNIPK